MTGLLLAGACGSGDGGTGGAVMPFSRVQDGAMRFEADPADPSGGIFRVTTTEPMICAIVWGEDTGYGRFNNSLAMNGTGITDHDVQLPDVEPGRTYHYVVQGTTADGTLYRSSPGTFTIETAELTEDLPGVALGGNLAERGAIAGVSSTFSEAIAASLAIDGDTATQWSTRGDGDDGFIVVEQPGPAEVVAVEFVTRSMGDGSAVTERYTVTVDDGEPSTPFAASTLRHRRVHELRASGTRFRFDVATSTGGNVGAVEIRIFAPA
ncbi:MAG: discoidin domain-containing protein [Acidimicrobiia bacterium]